MIEAKHVVPPQHLWRWDDPYVWVGRWRIPFDSVLDNKVAMTREELAEAAKVFFMLGFNAKTKEVQDLMRKAAGEFSHFKYMLPPEIAIPAKKTPPWAWLIAAVGTALVAAPSGIMLLSALVRGLRQ